MAEQVGTLHAFLHRVDGVASLIVHRFGTKRTLGEEEIRDLGEISATARRWVNMPADALAEDLGASEETGERGELAAGQPVTFTEPLLLGRPYARFLPGDRAYVVEPPRGARDRDPAARVRLRVRCPDTGEDGWVEARHVVARDPAEEAEPFAVQMLADGYGVCHGCGGLVHPQYGQEHQAVCPRRWRR